MVPLWNLEAPGQPSSQIFPSLPRAAAPTRTTVALIADDRTRLADHARVARGRPDSPTRSRCWRTTGIASRTTLRASGFALRCSLASAPRRAFGRRSATDGPLLASPVVRSPTAWPTSAVRVPMFAQACPVAARARIHLHCLDNCLNAVANAGIGRQGRFNLRLEQGHPIHNRRPDDIGIQVEVAVNQVMPHSDNGTPWNIRMTLAKSVGQLCGGAA